MASKPEHGSSCKPVIAGYANYFEVGHNAFEFLIDFGQIDPCSGKFHINTRIAVGPTHAKLLARLMSGAVSQYEDQFEPIPEVKDDDLIESILDTSPEFERRAMDARQRRSPEDVPLSEPHTSKRK
jgi:hypothetical protein